MGRYKKTSTNVKFIKNNGTIVLLGGSDLSILNLLVTREPPNHWWSIAHIVIRQKLAVVNYAGKANDTMAMILAKYGTQVTAYSPGYILLTPPLISLTNGLNAQQIYDDWKLVVEMAIMDDIIPIVTPMAPSSSISTTARIQVYTELNAMISDAVRDLGGIIYIDPWYTLMDSSLAYPGFQAAYTSGGSTLTFAGNIAAGVSAGNQLNQFLTNDFVPFARTMVEKPGCLNSIMYGTGGTSTIGPAPDNWTVGLSAGVTAVASKVARTDGRPGEWAQLAASAATAGDYMQYTQSTTSVSLAEAGFAAGDIIQGFIEFEYDGQATNITQITGTLYITDPVGGNVTLDMSFTPSADPARVGAGAYGIMASQPIEIPINATYAVIYNMRVVFENTFTSGTSGPEVVRFANPVACKVTNPIPGINQ